MRFDRELTLIREELIQDEIGNWLPVLPEQGTQILCAKKSVGRVEFYNAAATGLRPEVVLVMHPFEYGDERTVFFEGVRYKILRTYETSLEELELTCERVTGIG